MRPNLTRRTGPWQRAAKSRNCPLSCKDFQNSPKVGRHRRGRSRTKWRHDRNTNPPNISPKKLHIFSNGFLVKWYLHPSLFELWKTGAVGDWFIRYAVSNDQKTLGVGIKSRNESSKFSRSGKGNSKTNGEGRRIDLRRTRNQHQRRYEVSRSPKRERL